MCRTSGFLFGPESLESTNAHFMNNAVFKLSVTLEKRHQVEKIFNKLLYFLGQGFLGHIVLRSDLEALCQNESVRDER